MGWSRNVLVHQIKSQAYERHKLKNKQHYFKEALPVHLVKQAEQAMTDVYVLNMLGVEKPILEAELESHIVSKVQAVMLALRYGFAFIGNQYRIAANNTEYFIVLLFLYLGNPY